MRCGKMIDGPMNITCDAPAGHYGGCMGGSPSTLDAPPAPPPRPPRAEQRRKVLLTRIADVRACLTPTGLEIDDGDRICDLLAAIVEEIGR